MCLKIEIGLQAIFYMEVVDDYLIIIQLHRVGEAGKIQLRMGAVIVNFGKGNRQGITEDNVAIDIHEDGRFLYPGTGALEETGIGEAKGTKLNIPMPMFADDGLFLKVWNRAEVFLQKAKPEFILFQCGADSIAGDPITQLKLSAGFHNHVAKQLSLLANKLCEGRLLAMGGGGYNLENIAHGWNAVIEGIIE